MELESSCEDCGQRDKRVLTYVDANYDRKQIAHIVNSKATVKRLIAMVADGHVLCPTCLAIRLADIADDQKSQLREHKEWVAEINHKVRAEHGLATSLMQVGDELGEAIGFLKG